MCDPNIWYPLDFAILVSLECCLNTKRFLQQANPLNIWILFIPMHAHPLTHVTGLFERDDRVTIPNPLLELLRLRHFYCPHSRAPIPKEWTDMRVGFTDSPPPHSNVQDAIHPSSWMVQETPPGWKASDGSYLRPFVWCSLGTPVDHIATGGSILLESSFPGREWVRWTDRFCCIMEKGATKNVP